MRKLKYHYYVVEVPTEAFDTDEARGHAAIDEARERAHLYCMPANWSATKLSEGFEYTKFKVRRVVNA